MVGHTGVIPAAVTAIETVDACLAEVVGAVHEAGGACIITADHGNADHMLEPDGSPNTQHSLNPVPLIVTVPGCRSARRRRARRCRPDGARAARLRAARGDDRRLAARRRRTAVAPASFSGRPSGVRPDQTVAAANTGPIARPAISSASRSWTSGIEIVRPSSPASRRSAALPVSASARRSTTSSDGPRGPRPASSPRPSPSRPRGSCPRSPTPSPVFVISAAVAAEPVAVLLQDGELMAHRLARRRRGCSRRRTGRPSAASCARRCRRSGSGCHRGSASGCCRRRRRGKCVPVTVARSCVNIARMICSASSSRSKRSFSGGNSNP